MYADPLSYTTTTTHFSEPATTNCATESIVTDASHVFLCILHHSNINYHR